MKSWYLLYCKRGEQARAKAHLENQGVECFYPEIEVEKILRKKKQLVREPLFPSYIFVRFDYEVGPTFTTIRSTRGVVDFVRLGAHPKEVEGDLIYSLRQLEQSEQEVVHSETPRSGEKIEVLEGQFAGITAIYQEPDGDKRSFLLIELLNKPVKVSVDNSDIQF
ncbi:transcription/translation regulatory transformer protein RfaH [Vibrio sp. SCSIO 43136]|uniref:transcription/translation regulatory transformer protein RfaH n=1 Tax=Vibrio sp. SCSIO 43136 TaxID=2819101 RepID=UPI0020762987|nr:transcription/translation regulatory transformer protein RfaH [Vibrio sp. SCSIO 43136]USD64565.1 transcription/translation regulatory transformer protein RfaH [Vibrio sp. SCSIO 43136]